MGFRCFRFNTECNPTHCVVGKQSLTIGGCDVGAAIAEHALVLAAADLAPQRRDCAHDGRHLLVSRRHRFISETGTIELHRRLLITYTSCKCARQDADWPSKHRWATAAAWCRLQARSGLTAFRNDLHLCAVRRNNGVGLHTEIMRRVSIRISSWQSTQPCWHHM